MTFFLFPAHMYVRTPPHHPAATSGQSLLVLARQMTAAEVAAGMTMSSEMDLRPGTILLTRSAPTGRPKSKARMSTAALPKVKLSILRIPLAIFSNCSGVRFALPDGWAFCACRKTGIVKIRTYTSERNHEQELSRHFFFARKLSRIFETKNEKDLDVNGSPHIVLFLELLFCWYPVLQLPTALAELPEERLQAGERMFSEQSCQRVC